MHPKSLPKTRLHCALPTFQERNLQAAAEWTAASESKCHLGSRCRRDVAEGPGAHGLQVGGPWNVVDIQPLSWEKKHHRFWIAPTFLRESKYGADEGSISWYDGYDVGCDRCDGCDAKKRLWVELASAEWRWFRLKHPMVFKDSWYTIASLGQVRFPDTAR